MKTNDVWNKAEGDSIGDWNGGGTSDRLDWKISSGKQFVESCSGAWDKSLWHAILLIFLCIFMNSGGSYKEGMVMKEKNCFGKFQFRLTTTGQFHQNMKVFAKIKSQSLFSICKILNLESFRFLCFVLAVFQGIRRISGLSNAYYLQNLFFFHLCVTSDTKDSQNRKSNIEIIFHNFYIQSFLHPFC